MNNKIDLNICLNNCADTEIRITVTEGSSSDDIPSEEELRECCAKYDDCDDCPNNNYCYEL